MSLMNILSATLIVLIIGAGIAVFFGMRAADAASIQIDMPPLTQASVDR